MCGALLETTDFDWDHVVALRELPKFAPQAFQPLCCTCHSERTQLQGRQDRTLRSCFSPHAWQAYVKSPRPPALAFNPHKAEEDKELLELDVIRCRRNALVHSFHPFACFSPLDNIKQGLNKPGELSDFSYVRLPPNRRSRLSQLPYVGEGWYHKSACEFMLHHGKMTWDDILWSFQATAHVDVESVAVPLKQMEEAWGESNRNIAKLSCNSMIGLFALETDSVYHVRTSTSALDVPANHVFTREVCWENQCIFDFVYQTPLFTIWSYRAVHDQIMHTEHVRVAQLLYV
jgi:23S rRNA maturation mini-RNase III